MMSARSIKPTSHIVDVLGNVTGRDQPILRMENALQMVASIDPNHFSDSNVVFFDPFCKAGEILLACAFQSCINKTVGTHLVDSEIIIDEVYKSNRYFALAPDERHHRLSMRTFLGNENSHNQAYSQVIRDGSYLSEADGKLDVSKFKREFLDMIEYIKTKTNGKRIIAVGNPPYQESDGGFGKSASPVYSVFVDILMKNPDISEFTVVIPSRWFSGGKGLNTFRKEILQSNKVKYLKTFKNPREVFPTVDINGGVCFLTMSKEHDGPCNFVDGDTQLDINLSKFDAIPDDLMAYELIEKIRIKSSLFMSEYVMSRNPFGITSTTLRKVNLSSKQVPCMIKEREIIKISEELVLKNKNLIRKWKVVVPAAVGGTKAVRDFLPVNQFFIVEPGVALAETYIIIGTFDSKAESDKLLSFLKTSFCRYFIGLRKLTQHLSKECWTWVPQVDFSKTWDDQKLFNYFNLSKKEQDHIVKKVSEWS